MAKDKIFNAEKGEYSEDLPDTNFEINPRYTPFSDHQFFDDVDSVDERNIAEIIEEYLGQYEKKLKNRDYNFKKAEIAKIYSDIRKKTLDYPRIQMMMILCNYLSIKPNKMYNFLGNAHKNEIIEEFEEKTGMVSKRGVRRLF